MGRKLWVIILCAGAIMALAVGFRQALGLFLTPVTLDFGLGRETFALGMGLMNLVWGLASPVAGGVADKFGARSVIVLGGAAYVAGLLTMTLSGDGDQILLGGTLIGLGLSGTGFTVVLGTVGRATPERYRSRALALVSVGGSIGQFLALPYAHGLIEGFDWVGALFILAATAALIVPLAAGMPGRKEILTDAPGQTLRGALAAAAAIPGFWLLNAGFFVCGFHLAFVGVHLPAFLADQGFSPWLAATGLTVIGLSNIAGSFILGALGDAYRKKNVLSLVYLARAAIFLGFIIIPISEVSVLIFSAAIGFLWLGTVPLTSGLVGDLFGTRYMSMLFGIVFLGHQFGGFLGAWLAGRLFDASGSYDAMWWMSVGLGVLAALLHWPISEGRRATAASPAGRP